MKKRPIAQSVYTLVLAVLATSLHAQPVPHEKPGVKPKFDIKAARRNIARAALEENKKECASLIEAKRESADTTIVDCLGNDSFTILRYRIEFGATDKAPISIESVAYP